jgi:TIR domain
MDTRDVEAAVRRVLPAVNLDPGGFALDRGFIARAQRSERYLGSALNNMSCQFVFAGLRADAEAAQAEIIAADVLASLSQPTLAVCERLVVAWVDSGGVVLAAAYTVLPSGKLGKLLGCSWSDPEAWPEPMIDISKTGDELIEDALSGLESVVRDHLSNQTPTFAASLQRAFRLVDMALLRNGGEGQNTSSHPSASAAEESWRTWLTRYDRSVRDEWSRVRRSSGKRGPHTAKLTAGGPLSGLRIFLSYARPDATTLAWPVYEVLNSCGAEVWFDQERGPDEDQLAAGFAETIGECDAYIMCASDEFVERAGYATQELAWALQQRASGGKTRYFLIVAGPETILPTAVAGWPVIEFYNGQFEGLKRGLLACLQPSANVVPQAATPLPIVDTPPRPSLPEKADLRSALRRAQHVLRFDEIDQETVEKLLSGSQEDRHSNEVRQCLLHLGEGLDWDGTLQHLDLWPDDPLVRDVRYRLGSLRVLVGTRRVLNDNLALQPDVARDVEHLATQKIPILAWPSVAGWDDSARRLSLRHHVGLLRVLSEILRQGLDEGISDVPQSTTDQWRNALVARRRECADTLLALRSDARLTWRGDPPEWDALFRCWRKFLLDPDCVWAQPVPAMVLQLFTSNFTQLAAVAAQTVWYASRYKGLAKQRFVPQSGTNTSAIEVYALGADEVDAPSHVENTVRLGLIARPDRGATLCLSWNGEHFCATTPVRSTTIAAPDQLVRAINFFRI